MNTNEQQYDPCFLEEATHAKTATGYLLPLDKEKDAVLEDEQGRYIYKSEFCMLGITPVRKAEVKPVEFVGKAWGVSFDGNCTEITIRVGGNAGGQYGKDLIGRNLKVEVQP